MKTMRSGSDAVCYLEPRMLCYAQQSPDETLMSLPHFTLVVDHETCDRYYFAILCFSTSTILYLLLLL